MLLSLGYTLLTRAAENAVRAVGMDPYVGFLHADVYNRPSLALDLVEEFRVIIDGLALYVCNRGLVTPDDFRPGEEDERPVEMDRAAVKRYIQAYESRMQRVSRHPRTGERLRLDENLKLANLKCVNFKTRPLSALAHLKICQF